MDLTPPLILVRPVLIIGRKLVTEVKFCARATRMPHPVCGLAVVGVLQFARDICVCTRYGKIVILQDTLLIASRRDKSRTGTSRMRGQHCQELL